MLWKTIRRPLFCLVALVTMVFLCKGTSIAGSDGSQELFSNPRGLDYLDIKPTEKRTSLVNVNFSMLFDANGKALDAKQLPTVTLNLFSDAVFTGVVKNVVQDQFGTTWAGQLDGYQGGYFTVTVVEGVMVTHVASPTGVFEVSTAGNGLYKVIEIDQSKFKDCPEGAKYDPPGKILPAGDLGILADSAARIDVMVVYTTAARVAEGSVTAMKARIKSGIDLSNLAYAYSSVTPRLRLVHVEEVAYTESGNITTDVNRLTAQTDGYMDIVHTLRNIYGADMVSLLVNNGGGYCGMAKAIMANQSTAFQVTARDCITGNYSLQHEFGHLQGLRHDRYVDPATTPYAYGHGYIHPYSTDTGDRWRTVMAYNTQCSDSFGYNCTRLNRFSNPTKFWNSDPMGVVGLSENYRVLNQTAYTVANFRTQRIGNDFSSSFNGSTLGWLPVRGAWSSVSSAYYYSPGVANNGASARYNGIYGDLTYTVQMKRSGTYLYAANRLIIRGNPFSLSTTGWWSPSYYFQYSNDGQFSVWEYTSASTSVALKSWTTSAAIVKNGWNTLKVVAVGTSLKYYINNVLVWSGSDPTLRTGQVGLGFYRDATVASLLVNFAVLQTTPTADMKIVDMKTAEKVEGGIEMLGGSIDYAPRR